MQPETSRTVQTHIDRFLEHLEVQSMSPRTIDSYRSHLDILAAFLTSEAGVEAIEDVTPETLFRYQTYLYGWAGRRGRGLAIVTQAARLSAVRSLFRHLVRTDVLRFDPSSALTLPRRRYQLPRPILTKREVTRLLNAPRSGPLGLRDRAMLEVLYSTGIRNAELRRLELQDLDSEAGVLRINNGKGGEDRVVPMGRMAAHALHAYLSEARPRLAERGARAEQTVFLSKSGRPLLALGVIIPLRKHAGRARIAKSISPHTLRHTFATHMLEGRADLRHIQAMLGHRSIATTQIYTRVTTDDMVAAHERHHPRNRRGRPLKERCTQAYAQSHRGSRYPSSSC
ncbi:MAG: tyrosine-type recombinase/integrase [Candidatus Polarisedimenticolia bacterium]